MRTYLFALVAGLFFSACTATKQGMKVDYSVVPDGNEKVLKGIINRKIIENDTAFKWFQQNMKWANIDNKAIEAFAGKKDLFTVIVFGGTWCHDTQNLLPVFYKLVDKSNYPDNKISLIVTDRDKKTINDLHTKYNITNVPTFIVIRNGKEIGRVVEYGKTGAIDKELGEIVNSIQ